MDLLIHTINSLSTSVNEIANSMHKREYLCVMCIFDF